MTEYARVVNANGSRGPKVHIVNDHGRAKCDPHGSYTLERVEATLADAERMCKRCVHLVQRFEKDQHPPINFTSDPFGNLIPVPNGPRYGEQLMDPDELRAKLSSYWDPRREGYVLGDAFVPAEQAQQMTRSAIAQMLLRHELPAAYPGGAEAAWPKPAERLRVTFSIDIEVTYGQEFSNLCRAVESAIGKKGWSVLSLGGYGEDIVISGASRLDTQKIFREEEMDESAPE